MADPITRKYQAELKRTREAVTSRVSSYWDRLPDFRDNRIPGFLAATLPVVEAGQQRAVALTSAYLSRRLNLPPVGLNVAALTGANIRNGVEPAVVYRRAFETVWSSIESIGYAAAVQKGLARLSATADMDVAISSRNANLAFRETKGARIIGWTRISELNCCEYCQSIDGTQTGPTEPLPLHNRCGCTAEPITQQSSFSNTALIALGAVIGTAVGVVIHDHGELGPVITAAGDHFTTEAELDDSGDE